MDKELNPNPRYTFRHIIHYGVMLFDCEVKAIETMETFGDDIWVCGFPRSGMDALKNAGSPRLFKSHLQYHFLPKELRDGKGRMVYVCRNPKDVVLSYYKLLQWFDWCDMSLAEFFEDFISGKVLYGAWEDHVLGFWNNTEGGNVVFMKYEDVVKTIGDIASFLGGTLTDGDVNRIHQHCAIESMRKNPTLNLENLTGSKMKDGYGGFINKGKPGSWREALTSGMSSRLDEVLKQVAEKGPSFDCCQIM